MIATGGNALDECYTLQLPSDTVSLDSLTDQVNSTAIELIVDSAGGTQQFPSAAASAKLTTPPLSEEQLLALRFGRIIKPSFIQVYAKHQKTMRTESKMAEMIPDNHATLFHLFGFFDWQVCALIH